MHVGRSTIREAVKILQKEGLLTSRNGVGTYVNKRPALITNSLNRLKSMGEMIRDAGLKESEADIRIYRMQPEPDWAEKLQTDGDVVVLERTRTADGQKVAFYYNILPADIGAPLCGSNFTGGIMRYMEEKLGIRIAYALTSICAVTGRTPQDQKAAELLGTDVLMLRQLHFDTKDIPVLYSIDYLKSSAFNLTVRREP